MGRKYIDCRERPSQSNCSLTMAVDADQQPLGAAAQHAVSVHQHQDSEELRNELRRHFRAQTADRPQDTVRIFPAGLAGC